MIIPISGNRWIGEPIYIIGTDSEPPYRLFLAGAPTATMDITEDDLVAVLRAFGPRPHSRYGVKAWWEIEREIREGFLTRAELVIHEEHLTTDPGMKVDDCRLCQYDIAPFPTAPNPDAPTCTHETRRGKVCGNALPCEYATHAGAAS